MSGRTLLGRPLAFLGAGNMAEALVRGLLASGAVRPADVVLSDVRAERLRELAGRYGVVTDPDNFECAAGADIAVLAVKPQNVPEALARLKGRWPAGPMLLSICAGVRTARLEELLGGSPRVVRAMPNSPALVRCGAAAVCGGRFAVETDLEDAELLLGAVGIVARVREADMDAVTALSGSGPAYVCYLMEAMEQAAAAMGLEAAAAKRLIMATVEGTARMAAETGVPPAELRARVTSKGGTTQAALGVLEKAGVAAAIVQAIEAARARSGELSQGG